MCQAIRDGGRRCPIHQHQTIATVKVGAELSHLNRRQVESLVRELRREGRNATLRDESAMDTWREETVALVNDTAISDEIGREMTRGLENDRNPDGATQYAQQHLVTRAIERGNVLDTKFQEIANRTGLSKAEVKAKFDEFYAAVDVHRGAGPSDGYNNTVRARAVAANLPYDRASVVALEKLYAIPAQIESRPRITQWYRPASNSEIDRFGYDADGGRLEIAFTDTTRSNQAYHDIPADVWERLRTAARPGRIYNSRIRGVDEYMYDSAEAAEADRYALRCASCGQFRAASHACPQVIVRDQVAESGVPASEIAAATETLAPAEPEAEQVSVLDASVADLLENEGDRTAEWLTQRQAGLDRWLRDGEAAHAAAEAAQDSETIETPAWLNQAMERRSARMAGMTEQIIASQQVHEEQAALDAEAEHEAELEEAEPVAVPADTNPAETALSAIVVPAPDMPAVDFYSNGEATAPEVFDGGPFTVITATATDAAYTVTPDAQFAPAARQPTVLETVEVGYYGFTAMGGQEVRAQDVPDAATRQLIKDAPAHMRFLLDRANYNDSNTTPKIAWDSRQYSLDQNIRWDNATGQHRSVWSVRNLHQVANEGPDLSRNNPDYEEARANVRQERIAEVDRFVEMVRDGQAVSLVQNASSTRRYVFDANLRTQPGVYMPPVRDLQRAIRDNKVVWTSFGLNFGRSGLRSNHVDDQGFQVGNSHAAEISGQIGFRRNADGAIEILSSERQLKCNCWDYRHNYYCQHLNYAQRHVGNLVQQMIPTNMAAGRTVAPEATDTDGNPITHHRLMVASLRSRTDTEIVTAAEGDEHGDYVRCNAPLDNHRRRRDVSDYQFGGDIVLPPRLRPADPERPTPDELGAIIAYNSGDNHVTSFGVPQANGALRQAVRRSDVELPVRVTYGRYSWNSSGVVTGSIRYAQQADGNLENVQVRSNTLRCTCGRFTSGGMCDHVQTTVDQAYAALMVGGRQDDPAASLRRFQSRNSEAIHNERQIREIMAEDPRRTRDDAVELNNDRERLNRERRERQEAEQREYRLQRERDRAAAAQREAEEALRRNQESVTNSAAYRERAAARWADRSSYAESQGQFYADYQAAVARKRNGENPVEFRTENVTDGICADEPGARQFGIELEFDIKRGVDKWEALATIGRELHAAGLTNTASQQRYHAAGAQGYAKWSFEQDCTVDAELVSPLMKDTPEDWAQLQQAIEIITRNGGIATTRTGSHVHVSTASYESSAAKHVELVRTVNQYDDILYRMASSPERGKHRGMRWCAPNVNDSHEDVNADVAASHNLFGYNYSSHNIGLNFQGTQNADYKKSNIEFRMWDGTLDAATIQQQVVMSAAITDYAERSVIESGVSRQRHRDRIGVGTNRDRERDLLQPAGPRRNASGTLDGRLPVHTEETFQQVNGHVGDFFDKLFRRAEDRAAATSLFAATNWQESPSL